jgi:hypothetical protein
MSNRITWSPGMSSGFEGRAGKFRLFGIHWGSKRQEEMWSLSTNLPISSQLLGQHYRTPAGAKAAAEKILDGFIRNISGGNE